MLKKIGLGLGIFVAVVLIYAAVQPVHYTVSRETVILASAEKIFPYLSNSKMAEQWGPWMEIDPQTKMVYSGPDSGVGSKSSWSGGKNLGTGSATIVDVVPLEKVVIKLEYTEPMNMVQEAQYLVKATPAGTVVTWRVEGDNSYLCRLMGVFMNMDKMVGSMFEKGLSNLKALMEKA